MRKVKASSFGIEGHVIEIFVPSRRRSELIGIHQVVVDRGGSETRSRAAARRQ
jgi:hypothetical protein